MLLIVVDFQMQWQYIFVAAEFCGSSKKTFINFMVHVTTFKRGHHFCELHAYNNNVCPLFHQYAFVTLFSNLFIAACT